MKTKKDKLVIIQTRITEKELSNHKRELRKATQKWAGKLRPLEKLVMLFWAVINPIIWRLGRKYKWVRTNYKKIRKGKWLWGIIGLIEDYEPLEADEKYTLEDYENFQKFTEEIFKYESPK